MDIYDLQEFLETKYQVLISHEKLLTTISNTNLYYDSIMETVYIDYDTYFEEI